MDAIRVVWGTGRGPTEVAAYDAALARANIHNYNLIHVSSVVPAAATVEAVGTAPDLGPAGDRLTVVEGRATTAGTETVSAGIGWATGPGPGLFYEASGADPDRVREAILTGLEEGRALREWDFEDEDVVVTTAEGDGDGYTTAVTLAVYGESESIF